MGKKDYKQFIRPCSQSTMYIDYINILMRTLKYTLTVVGLEEDVNTVDVFTTPRSNLHHTVLSTNNLPIGCVLMHVVVFLSTALAAIKASPKLIAVVD